MKTATTVVQMLVRLVGTIILILGILMWTRILPNVISIHMLLGFILVVLLWTMAGLATRARVNLGLIALAVVWSLIVPIFGMTQSRLFPGSMHWVIQVLHLLVGLGAMGISEALASRIKRSWNTALLSGEVRAV